MAGVVWWEIETTDPERFQHFHGALSDWTFRPAFSNTELHADYWIIEHNNESIGGLQRAQANAPTPAAGTRIYLAVDNLESTLAQATNLGGTVERPRTALGGNDRWFATYQDPTGISIGLWTQHPSTHPAN